MSPGKKSERPSRRRLSRLIGGLKIEGDTLSLRLIKPTDQSINGLSRHGGRQRPGQSATHRRSLFGDEPYSLTRTHAQASELPGRQAAILSDHHVEALSITRHTFATHSDLSVPTAQRKQSHRLVDRQSAVLSTGCGTISATGVLASG
jgi:hypothetical protein